MLKRIFVFLILLLITLNPVTSNAEMISRRWSFDHISRYPMDISSDAKTVLYYERTPYEMRLYWAPTAATQTRTLIDSFGGARTLSYAYFIGDGHQIVYFTAQDGREDKGERMYLFDAKTGIRKDISPSAYTSLLSYPFDGKIGVTTGEKDDFYSKTARLFDIKTGKFIELLQNKELKYQNGVEFNHLCLNECKDIITYSINNNDLYVYKNATLAYKHHFACTMDAPGGCSAQAFSYNLYGRSGQIYITSSDAGHYILDRLDLNTLTLERVQMGGTLGGYQNPIYDFERRMIIGEKRVGTRASTTFYDPQTQADWDKLTTFFKSPPSLVDQETRSGAHLIHSDETGGNGISKYYAYRRGDSKPTFLFDDTDAPTDMPRQYSTDITVRDGLNISAYYALPAGSDADGDGKPDKPLPLVLHIHGGPWARDYFSDHTVRQILASRGYAVMNINFRGSDSVNAQLLAAGRGQYGTGALDDMADAIRWAISQGIADPAKVATYGGSYGGYAALALPERYPDMIRCTVAENAVTDIEDQIAFWSFQKNLAGVSLFRNLWGNDLTADGAQKLRAESPIYHLDRLRIPVVLIAGAQDKTVPVRQSDRLFEAASRLKKDILYVRYNEREHGYQNEGQNVDPATAFFRSTIGIVEASMHDCLGGTYEPLGNEGAYSGGYSYETSTRHSQKTLESQLKALGIRYGVNKADAVKE